MCTLVLDYLLPDVLFDLDTSANDVKVVGILSQVNDDKERKNFCESVALPSQQKTHCMVRKELYNYLFHVKTVYYSSSCSILFYFILHNCEEDSTESR